MTTKMTPWENHEFKIISLSDAYLYENGCCVFIKNCTQDNSDSEKHESNLLKFIIDHQLLKCYREQK
jgi:hypothetical protein